MISHLPYSEFSHLFFGVFPTDLNQKQFIITLKYTNRTLTVLVSLNYSVAQLIILF